VTKLEVIDGLISMARVFHDDVARQWERDVVIAAIDLLAPAPRTRCYISAADWARLPANTYLKVSDINGRPCEIVVGEPPHGLVDEHGVKLEKTP
jgi:hypothetical protein